MVIQHMNREYTQRTVCALVISIHDYQWQGGDRISLLVASDGHAFGKSRPWHAW